MSSGPALCVSPFLSVLLGSISGQPGADNPLLESLVSCLLLSDSVVIFTLIVLIRQCINVDSAESLQPQSCQSEINFFLLVLIFKCFVTVLLYY